MTKSSSIPRLSDRARGISLTLLGVFSLSPDSLLIRLANSAEVQLVFLLESILGPPWVWLVINGAPALITVIGGSMLLLSIAWFARQTIEEES